VQHQNKIKEAKLDTWARRDFLVKIHLNPISASLLS